MLSFSNVIYWFNTICYVICARHFPANRSLALSLSISFNGVSAALYTLITNAINSSDDTLYLLLDAIVPVLISGLVLIPILHQPQPQQNSLDTPQRDSLVFLFLNILTLVTGLYLIFLYSFCCTATIARVILIGVILLLVMLLFLLGIVFSREWSCFTVPTSFSLYNSRFTLADPNDHKLYKELIGSEDDGARSGSEERKREKKCCLVNVLQIAQLTVLGEEHSTKMLMCRWDFWQYYIAYFCGGTIGLAYSNNLGQISQSLGHYSQISSLVTLYSTCSFFDCLLAATPDFLSRLNEMVLIRIPSMHAIPQQPNFLRQLLNIHPFPIEGLHNHGLKQSIDTSNGFMGEDDDQLPTTTASSSCNVPPTMARVGFGILSFHAESAMKSQRREVGTVKSEMVPVLAGTVSSSRDVFSVRMPSVLALVGRDVFDCRDAFSLGCIGLEDSISISARTFGTLVDKIDKVYIHPKNQGTQSIYEITFSNIQSEQKKQQRLKCNQKNDRALSRNVKCRMPTHSRQRLIRFHLSKDKSDTVSTKRRLRCNRVGLTRFRTLEKQ
ncbi:Protein NUCLEAR FUSION DEFECTIVE 4, partial [Mucuna pruriens]